MRFTDGLKKIFSQAIFAFIYLFIIACYILLIIGVYLGSPEIGIIFFFIVGTLIAFTSVLLLFSILMPVEEMKPSIILVVALITIPFVFFFSSIFELFYLVALFINHFLTSLFAFNFGLKMSEKLDDSLNNKKTSGKVARGLEFIIFGALNVYFLWYAWTNITILSFVLGSLFFVLIWIELFLIGIVLLRLLFTKKFAGFISLFFVLVFIYILFLVFYTIPDLIFPPGSFTVPLLIIDLILLTYMVASIFGRVEFIKEKIKIFREDTIALFVMVMKLIVGTINLGIVPVTPEQTLLLSWWILILSIGCTFIFGFFGVLTHKKGK